MTTIRAKKLCLRLLVLASSVVVSPWSHAERPVIPVYDVKINTLRDESTAEYVMQAQSRDFQRRPEIRELQSKIVEMLKRLEIGEDSDTPIILIIEDDMTLNASYLKAISGPDILTLNLGVFAAVSSDDELAFILGHELEHGNSVINDKLRFNAAFETFTYGYNSREITTTKLMQRVAENEVDLKSIIHRLLEKGYNPAAARTALMKTLGMDVGVINPTHTRSSTRIDAIDALLLGLKRKAGQRFDKDQKQTAIVSPELKSWLGSAEFKQSRKQIVEDLATDIEEKILQLSELLEREAEAIKSGDEDIQQQIGELTDFVLGNLDSSQFLIRKAHDHLVPEVGLREKQLQFQRRIVDAMDPVREAIISHHLGPHLGSVRGVIRMALYSGSSHLDVNNWSNHIVKKYTRYYELTKKMDKIHERLATGDFSSWDRHDDTADVVTARLQLQRLPEQIEKAFAEYLAEAELWYQLPEDLAEFHTVVRNITKSMDENSYSKVPKSVSENFSKLREMEAHLGPARKRIAEFAGKSGIRIQKLMLPEPNIMFREHRRLIVALAGSSQAEDAERILAMYLSQLSQQLVTFAELETNEIVANVITNNPHEDPETAVNTFFLEVIKSVSACVTEDGSKSSLAITHPEVQKFYHTADRLLLDYQSRHGLTVELEPYWSKEDFSSDPNSTDSSIKISKTRAQSENVTQYQTNTFAVFKHRHHNAIQFLQFQMHRLETGEISVDRLQQHLRMGLKNKASEFKKHYQKGGSPFPVDLKLAMANARILLADGATLEDPQTWDRLKFGIFQGALSSHYFDFFRLDPDAATEIYRGFVEYYRILAETGDSDTLQIFDGQLGIYGFLYYAALKDIPKDQLIEFLNSHHQLFKYESQYEVAETTSVEQMRTISEYMYGFDFSALSAEIHNLVINASFNTYLKATGVNSQRLEEFYRAYVEEQKQVEEWNVYEPFRRIALLKIKEAPTVATFVQLFNDIHERFNISHRSDYVDLIPTDFLNRDKLALMAIGFAEFLKGKSADGVLSSHEKSDVGFFIRDNFKVEIYENLNGLSPEVKSQFIHMMMTSMNPDAIRDSMFHDYMDEVAKSGGDMEYFMNPVWISGFFYDSYRIDLAYWQLQNRFKINDLARDIRSGQAPLPQNLQVRTVLKEILKFVDLQFPGHSMAKEQVLNRVENDLLTSQAETRFVLDYRANSGNWSESGKIATFDFPENLQRNMKSAEDKFQMIEYLLNTRAKLPGFVDRMYQDYYTQATDTARNRPDQDGIKKQAQVKFQQGKLALTSLKALFKNQSPTAQAVILSQLLGREERDILGDPVYTEKVISLILGDHSDSLIVNEIFKGYLDSAPEEQYKHLISYILAAKHTSDEKSQSLKPIFEAMGAFGIKAAQFLYSSGMLSADMAEDLKDFLSSAAPPPRYEVIHFLEKAFGKSLTDITHIGELLGSGSINFVVEVQFEHKGIQQRRVVRIRRPFLEGLNENENEIWEKVVKRLQDKISQGKNLSREELQQLNDAASIINEARRQAYATLRESGRELDLRYERDMEAVVESYQRDATEPALSGWVLEPIKHDPELQKLVPESMQTLISIYEKVDHTALRDLGNDTLRTAIAMEILRTELRALFHHGIFDPDGHLGNWLIDVNGKRLVRIDYAQALKLTPEVRSAFRNVFFELISPQPTFQGLKKSSDLLQLLELPEGIRIQAEDLTALDVNIRAKNGNFHQRLFELRKAINRHLKDHGLLGEFQEVQFSEEMRAAFSSLSKMRKLQDEIGDVAFFNEFNRYNTKTTLDSLKLKAWNLWNRFSQWFESDQKEGDAAGGILNLQKTALNTGPLPESEVSETLDASDFQNEILKDDIIPQGQGLSASSSRLGILEVNEDHVKMDLQRAATARPNDPVILITKRQFEALPIGTELHSYHLDSNGKRGKLVMSVTKDDSEVRDYNGTMNYGVLRTDYERWGGPARSKVLSAAAYLSDLSHNIVTRAGAGLQLVLLTQAQLDELPDGVMLVNRTGARFLKGNKNVKISPYPPNPMFVDVGIPNSAIKGFEEVGVDFDKVLSSPLPACSTLLRGLKHVNNP